MYIVAFVIGKSNGEINIVVCRDDDELIETLNHITDLDDEFEDVNDVDSAFAVLDNAMANDYFCGELSITVADFEGSILFQY